jgi:hypothetical protein
MVASPNLSRPTMSNCCSASESDNTHSKKRPCPVNGGDYAEVSVRTISHHIKASWDWVPTAEQYFFCDDVECSVAYFGGDGSVILKSQLRTRIGINESSGADLLCYCFGVSKAAFIQQPSTRNFIMQKTKAGLCSCETSNPSGRCCLKYFPKPGS